MADVAIASPACYSTAIGISAVNRLARGVSIYLGWLAAGKGLTVALQIVLGRWLGPASYGLYSLGYSVISLISWAAVLGLDQGVLRYCALYRAQGQPSQARAILWRAVKLAGIASVLTSTLLVLGSRAIAGRFFTPQFEMVLAGFSLTLPFLALNRITGTYLQSVHDIFRMSILQLSVRPALNMAFLVVAIGFGWGLLGAVGAYVLCCIGAAGLSAYFLAKKLPAKPANNNKVLPIQTPLMRYSLALMVAGLSYQVILRAPQVLLGHLSSSVEVGVFSAGASFALGFGFMTSTFLQPAMPMMVELHETGHSDGLRCLYQNSTRWTLAVVTPVFLFLCLFSGEVMKLFGRNFRAADPILVAMSLGWLIYYGKGPGGALLQMTGRQNLGLMNMLGVAVLTVIANYIAIPRFGSLGAALATASSVGVWALVEYIEVRLLYGLSPWSSGAQRNILAATVTAAVTVSLKSLIPWEALLAVSALVYASLYFGFCLEHDDRRLIAAGLARLRN